MNRKTFLASLAGLAAIPFVGKKVSAAATEPEIPVCLENPVKIEGIVLIDKNYNIVEACERIRREAEQLAYRSYSFRDYASFKKRMSENQDGIVDLKYNTLQ